MLTIMVSIVLRRLIIQQKEIQISLLLAVPIFMQALAVKAMTKMVTELEAKVTGI